MKPKQEFIDQLTQPRPIELALEHLMEIFSQIPIKVVCSGATAQQVIAGSLKDDAILTFVTHRQSLMPFPTSEPMQRLKNMTVKDESVHHQITDLAIDTDEFSFLIDGFSVIVSLIEAHRYPKVDDPNCVAYRHDFLWVPNIPKSYQERNQL